MIVKWIKRCKKVGFEDFRLWIKARKRLCENKFYSIPQLIVIIQKNNKKISFIEEKK